MFEKFTARRPQPRKAPVEPLTASPDAGAAKAGEQQNGAQPGAPKGGTRPEAPERPPERTKEIDGPSGPEPTRYGDWERKGICVDF